VNSRTLADLHAPFTLLVVWLKNFLNEEVKSTDLKNLLSLHTLATFLWKMFSMYCIVDIRHIKFNLF